MQLGIGPHLQETEIEQYSMGALPEERLKPFEEHFLVCEFCQDQLLEMEAYVNAVRSVSPKLRAAREPVWRRLAWFAVPAMAVAVAALLMIIPAPRRGAQAIVLE